jgi:hypothetical protein
VPNVTAADVDRIARRDFPPDQVAPVLAALAAYGPEKWHNEPVRVRVALLKLSDGSLDRLHTWMKIAQTDYRDALAAAEYPAYMKDVNPTASTSLQHTLAINTDATSYRQWLERKQFRFQERI